jgi:predicted nucleotidyltransferase
MTLQEVRSRYRARLVAAAERRGARNVRVFGSAARGGQRCDSGIDFRSISNRAGRCPI